MITIIASVCICSGIILFLVIILNYAESKLLPQGEVKILINKNEEKSPMVNPGSTLLSSLANMNIFIPSACGGGGTATRREECETGPSTLCQ